MNRYENPLIEACYKNDLEKVKSLLLEHGADPNLQAIDGWTVLLEASLGNNIDMVRLLLDHGADPNLQDSTGGTASKYASYFGRTDMVRLIWGRTIVKPLTDLDIFPEGLIREHLTV
jgi:ankyrin repeat protein